MHDSSYNRIREFVAQFLDSTKELKILDVGSMDVNGSYAPIFLAVGKWTYTGADIEPGKNVDLIIDPYKWTNIPDESYDVVVSGQCLEHTKMPWKTVEEISRVCKKGGIVMLTAPWSFIIHRYPIDCWRILPDGMKVLLEEIGKLEVITVENNNCDCFGVARKPL